MWHLKNNPLGQLKLQKTRNAFIIFEAGQTHLRTCSVSTEYSFSDLTQVIQNILHNESRLLTTPNHHIDSVTIELR